MIAPRLKGFKQKSNTVYNCACPLCGDSPKKKRGYFIVKSGMLFYYCHKCMASKRFDTFLREYDVNLFDQYRIEKFKDKMGQELSDARDEVVKESPVKHIPETKKYIPDIFDGLPMVSELGDRSQALLYCTRRKLPIYEFDFRYAKNFIEWANGNTDKFKEWKGVDHSRIIIPWRDRNQKIIGYSARALDSNQEQKYYRIFIDDDIKEKFFGIDRLDDTKQVYVLEGEIDSLMIPNAVAVANGKLQQYMNPNAIYIPDNDRRNKHIMLNVSRMIDAGLKVCLMPADLPSKDLNGLVECGWSTKDILGMIHKNTVQGMSGKLQFNLWKIADI